jgi:hypothetical protein
VKVINQNWVCAAADVFLYDDVTTDAITKNTNMSTINLLSDR